MFGGGVADQEADLGAMETRRAARIETVLEQRLRCALTAILRQRRDILDGPGIVLAGRAGEDEGAARPQLLVLVAR